MNPVDPVQLYKTFHGDLDSLLEQVERSRNELVELTSRIKRGKERVWKVLTPGLVDRMLGSKEQTEAFLTDSNPRVRIVALDILSMMWIPDDDKTFRTRLEELAYADSDENVRAMAITILADRLSGTDDVVTGKRLAETVTDETAATRLRWTAYTSLFALRRLRTPSLTEDVRLHLNADRLPDDLDWSFVESFMDSNRSAAPISSDMPSRDASPTLRGFAAYKRSRFAEAVQCFTAGLLKNPDAWDLLYLRGCAHLENGSVDDAIADLTRLIERLPLPQFLHQRREAYLKAGMLAHAESDLESAQMIEERIRRECS